MAIIEFKTLIDITNTKVVRLTQGSQLEIDQNRNFTTLLQCIEIRSIVSFDQPPTVEKIDIKGLEFGSQFKGKHNVWTFRCQTDRDDVYSNNGEDLALLLDDVHQVPIVKKLTETINIDKAVFDCKNSQYKNILIKALPGII